MEFFIMKATQLLQIIFNIKNNKMTRKDENAILDLLMSDNLFCCCFLIIDDIYDLEDFIQEIYLTILLESYYSQVLLIQHKSIKYYIQLLLLKTIKRIKKREKIQKRKLNFLLLLLYFQLLHCFSSCSFPNIK